MLLSIIVLPNKLIINHCSTGMVDRITPAMNADTRRALNERSGINDLIPVIAEDFKQWVLEDNFKYGRPEYEAAGMQN